MNVALIVTISYVVWICLLCCFGAISLIAYLKVCKKRLKAYIGFIGTLLTWGFISAFVGLFEINNYAATPWFVLSLAAGVIGVGFVIISLSSMLKKT